MDDKPGIVPDKLKTNINIKIIAGIIAAVIIFQVIVNYALDISRWESTSNYAF